MRLAALPFLLGLSTTVVAQDDAEPALRAPRGLTAPVPGHDGFDPAVAALGRALFADKDLSVDRQTACVSCHSPAHGFASVEALAAGSLGKRALRNAPTLYNRAWGRAFGWDGKAPTLEEQVIAPISNPNEMALSLADAVERLRASDVYAARFEVLFGRPANAADLSVALASYVRTIVHGDSVVDDFRAADVAHLTTEERAGLWIYEGKGRCWKCHDGPNFSDERFHNTGIGVRDGQPEPGRMAVTGDPADAGAFKTPTLRGLTETAPYMHDGSLASLEDVVAFYRHGGNRNERLDARVEPLALTDAEAGNLVAFLRALSRRR